MASRLAWRPRLLATATPITRQLAARRAYSASHDAHHEELKFPEETFFSPFWRNTILVVLVGFVWTRYDQHLAKSGEKHPITKWLEYHMTPEAETRRIRDLHLDQTLETAGNRILFQDAQLPPIYRVRYPEAFESASPHGLITGNQADLSDLRIK